MEWKESFKISEHEKMIDDLNHISTQLENFYWYFLASIAAIGLAYKTIIGKDLELCSNQKTWMILCICLIGNIVFWLIGEYSISHGFLFRFIQSKAARTEHEVWGTSKKDPCNINKYIRFDRNGKRIFYMDHLLPDQFIPLYWASIGLISLNAIIPFFLLQYVIMIDKWWHILIIYLCSAPLIGKLWAYYIRKIEGQFDDKN